MADSTLLLTSQEVAERIGVSPRKVARLARLGRLPGTKRGGRWVFDDDELYEAIVDIGLAMIARERIADPTDREGTPFEEFLASLDD
jgi:excisionase family DNA binding protein